MKVEDKGQSVIITLSYVEAAKILAQLFIADDEDDVMDREELDEFVAKLDEYTNT